MTREEAIGRLEEEKGYYVSYLPAGKIIGKAEEWGKAIEAYEMAIEALKSTKCESEVKIYPDGENELDPCEYELVEKRKNCTVEVLKCKKCGHIEIIWTDNDKFPEEEEE